MDDVQETNPPGFTGNTQTNGRELGGNREDIVLGEELQRRRK